MNSPPASSSPCANRGDKPSVLKREKLFLAPLDPSIEPKWPLSLTPKKSHLGGSPSKQSVTLLDPPCSPNAAITRRNSVGSVGNDETTHRAPPPRSPLVAIARKLSWSNMESLLIMDETEGEKRKERHLPSSPLRSIARDISWSNMEAILGTSEEAKHDPKPSNRNPQRKTLRQKSSSASNLARHKSRPNHGERHPTEDTPPGRHGLSPKTKRKTIRKRSSSLSKLVKPAPISPHEGGRQATPSNSPMMGKKNDPGDKSRSRKSRLSPKDSSSPRKGAASERHLQSNPNVSQKKGRSDSPLKMMMKSLSIQNMRSSPRKSALSEEAQSQNNPNTPQRKARGDSPLKRMAKSLSVQSMRAFSPTRTKRDTVDIRQRKTGQPKKSKTDNTNRATSFRVGAKEDVNAPASEPFVRGRSPLKGLTKALSLRRSLSPMKSRKETLDLRPEEKKRQAKSSKSPKKGKTNDRGLSLSEHMSNPTETESDAMSVTSSVAGSRARVERAASRFSLCSGAGDTAAVDTSTEEAAAYAAELVRSCSPERRNSGFHIRNDNVGSQPQSQFRRQQSFVGQTNGSPLRRQRRGNDPLSVSMHSAPRQHLTADDPTTSLSASMHCTSKGIRKQLSTRHMDQSTGTKAPPASPRRQLSLSPKREPSRQGSTRKITTAGGLSVSLHREPSQRIRGMKHPPKTKLNNTRG